MFGKKTWITWLFAACCVLATASNLTTARGESYVVGNGNYKINKLVEDRHWVESAPIVLMNHFSTVDVYRLGNAKTTGVSFSDELVKIYRIRHVDNKPPLDIRKKKKWGKLLPYVEYSSTASCRVNEKSGICILHLVWDSSNSSPNRQFVTARIANTSFALIDTNLLRNVVGVTKW